MAKKSRTPKKGGSRRDRRVSFETDPCDKHRADQLAERFGVKRSVIERRAFALGLTKLEEEDALLPATA